MDFNSIVIPDRASSFFHLWNGIILPVIFVVFLVIMIVKLIKIIAKAADKRIGLDKSIEAYNVIYPHAFRPEPSVSYYSLKSIVNIFAAAAAFIYADSWLHLQL